MLEVDEKIDVVTELGKKKLRSYINENEVPVVVSPHGELFVIDHHHFLCVCYHVGIRKVRVKVVKDLSASRMSFSQFWKWMAKNKNFYPFCQFGEGPRKALYLPKDIRGLADDPYRSLALFVRKAGAFDNSDRNFAEFKWANFFRGRHLLDRHGMRGFATALVKATKLAQSPAARRLPGYGQLKTVAQEKVLKKAKSRGKSVIKSHS